MLRLDWEIAPGGKLGPASGTATITLALLFVAAIGHFTGLPWWYAALGGVAGVVAVVAVGAGLGVSVGVVVHRLVCVVSAAVWAACVWAGGGPYAAAALLAWGSGAAVFGGVEWVVSRQRRAADEQRAERLVATVRQRRAHQWESWVKEVCNVTMSVVGVEAWEPTDTCDEPGYTVDGRLHGGATAASIATYAANLASRAGLGEGCGVNVVEGAGRDRVLIDVRIHNALADEIPYPLDCPEGHADDDYDVGKHADSSLTLVNTRQNSVLIVGQKGGGKTNLLRVFIARLSEMVDQIVLVVDLKGNLIDDFVRPYLDGRAERPAVDFVVRTPERAVEMCEMLERIGRARAAAPEYARLKREHNTDLLPVSPTLPQITVVVDEGKGITGLGVTDRNRMRLAQLLLTIQEEFRGEGINIIRTSLRPTGDALGGIDARIQSGLLFMLRSKDEEIHKLFDNSAGLKAVDIPYPGNALYAEDSSRPKPTQTYRLKPAGVEHVALAVAGRRAGLDAVALAAGGETWDTRWADEHIDWLLDGTAGMGTEGVDTRPVNTSPSPRPPGGGGDDPFADMDAAVKNMNDIADQIRRREEDAERDGYGGGPSQADIDAQFDEIMRTGWAVASGSQENAAGKPDPKTRMLDLLRDAGPGGMGASAVFDALFAEGLTKTRQAVNDWLRQAVREGSAVQPRARGPYIHADYSV